MKIPATSVFFAAAATGVVAEKHSQCGLWLAESILNPGKLVAYAGRDFGQEATIGEPELHVPVLEFNVHAWTPWHEYEASGLSESSALLESFFHVDSFIPGIASHVECSGKPGNLIRRKSETVDSSGVNRKTDASAGSFTYRTTAEFETTRPVKMGEELVLNCQHRETITEEDTSPARPIQWLEENGICVDSIFVKESTLPKIGKGAFAKRSFKKGEVITSSPVIELHRSQMEIVEQFQDEEDTHRYTEFVEQQQLLLNYCYGHTHSNVLLLPYGPGVNFINHRPVANTMIRWSRSRYSDADALSMSAQDVVDREEGTLILDYVATLDIEEGEEIFLDYGPSWQEAWEEHVQGWESPEDSVEFSAAEYSKIHMGEPIRTVNEQDDIPYPDNLETACLYYDDSESLTVEWTDELSYCIRPCSILSRLEQGGDFYYTAEVGPILNLGAPSHCRLSADSKIVTGIPSRAITLVDEEYTSDQHLENSFRREIDAPAGLYPDTWMVAAAGTLGDFIIEDLRPGEIKPMRWNHNGEVVTPNSLEMGLSPKVRESLLDYVKQLGIDELFRELTFRGNPIELNTEDYYRLQGLNYQITRPGNNWNSDTHRVSPADEISHQDFLRALSAAGFDEILQQMGEYFELNHAAVYQVSLTAVSHRSSEKLNNVENTSKGHFNLMVPLMLVESTSPEVFVVSEIGQSGLVSAGQLHYRYDVATLWGDNAPHAIMQQDYRLVKDMYLVANIQFGEIREDNVDLIRKSVLIQNFPPQDRPDILLSMAGRHWNPASYNAHLPAPATSDFESQRLLPYSIEPLVWERSSLGVSGMAYRVGLPEQLRYHLLAYSAEAGIAQRLHSLTIGGEQLEYEDTEMRGTIETLDDQDWFVQGPPEGVHSNMHWISPGDENTHADLLAAMNDGGFDLVLEEVGDYFELEGLKAYKLAFMAVSECESGYEIRDITDLQGTAFTMTIPLFTMNKSPLKFELENAHGQAGVYNFVFDEALLVGDYLYSSIPEVNEKKHRFVLIVDVAEVNADNVLAIADTINQSYPPPGEDGVAVLLGVAGQNEQEEFVVTASMEW
jgi:hypothetical protein